MSRTIGIEIEMYIFEDKFQKYLEDIGDNPAAAYGTYITRFKTIDRILNQIGCSGWTAKQDGSLSTEQIGGEDVFGIEVVTPPLTWEQVKQQIPLFYKTFMKFGTAEDETAGLHVHIDVSDLINEPKTKAGNEQIINKLMMLMLHYKSAEPVFDMMVAKHRQDNEFAETVHYNDLVKRYAKAIFLLSNKGNLPEIIESLGEDRYTKLNILSLHKQPTVEFRQHEGTDSPQKVLLWVSNCLNFINVFNTAEKVFDNFLIDTKKMVEQYQQKSFSRDIKREMIRKVFEEMSRIVARRLGLQIRNLVMDATGKNISNTIMEITNYIRNELIMKKKKVEINLGDSNLLAQVQKYFKNNEYEPNYTYLRKSKIQFTPTGIILYPFSDKEWLKQTFENEYKNLLQTDTRYKNAMFPSIQALKQGGDTAKQIATKQKYSPIKQIQEELKLILQELK